MNPFFITETKEGISLLINLKQICTIESLEEDENLCRITFSSGIPEALFIRENFTDLAPRIGQLL